MNDRPFALFLTWTTYGTWLPGDRRGHVSNTIRHEGVERKRNQPGTEYAADHEFTRRRAAAVQKYPAVRLSPSAAVVAAESIVESAESRRWRVVRGAVMANHVHIVLCDVPDDGPGVPRVLKGLSQKALTERVNGGRPMRYVEAQEWMLARIVDGCASACAE